MEGRDKKRRRRRRGREAEGRDGGEIRGEERPGGRGGGDEMEKERKMEEWKNKGRRKKRMYCWREKDDENGGKMGNIQERSEVMKLNL